MEIAICFQFPSNIKPKFCNWSSLDVNKVMGMVQQQTCKLIKKKKLKKNK